MVLEVHNQIDDEEDLEIISNSLREDEQTPQLLFQTHPKESMELVFRHRKFSALITMSLKRLCWYLKKEIIQMRMKIIRHHIQNEPTSPITLENIIINPLDPNPNPTLEHESINVSINPSPFDNAHEE